MKDFNRDFLKLLGGQAGAATVGLILAPLLTRLYTPASFYDVTLITSITAILTSCSTGSYHKAIPLATTRKARLALVLLSLSLTILATGAVFVIAYLALAFLAENYDHIDGVFFPLALAFTLLVTSVMQMTSIYLNNAGSYTAVSLRPLVERLTTITSQLSLTFTTGIQPSKALTIGMLLGACAGCSVGSVRVLRENPLGLIRNVKLAFLKKVAFRFSDFPLFQTPAEIVSRLGMHSPVLLLGIFYAPAIVGLYALSYRVVQIPAFLFTTSSAQLYFIECASCIKRKQSIAPVTLHLFTTLARLTALPCLTLLLFAPELFSEIFGEAWARAGVFSQILAPWAMITVVGSPLLGILAVTQRLREHFLYSTVLTTCRILVLLLCGAFLNPEPALLIYSATNTFIWVAIVVRLLYLAELSAASLFRSSLTHYGVALLASGPALCAKLVGFSDLIVLSLIACAFCAFLALQPEFRRFVRAKLLSAR